MNLNLLAVVLLSASSDLPTFVISFTPYVASRWCNKKTVQLEDRSPGNSSFRSVSVKRFSRREDDDETPLALKVIDRSWNFVSFETPLLGIELGYILILGGIACVSSIVQTILTILLFGLFYFAVRELANEGDDIFDTFEHAKNDSKLMARDELESNERLLTSFSLFGAAVLGSIIAPREGDEVTSSLFFVFVLLALPVTVLVSGVIDLKKDSPSIDQQLMAMWDQKFANRNHREK
jgi:hypothetical protein